MIITILRKPLEGTVVDNTLKHGCGTLNVDASRIGNLVQDTSKNGRSPDKHKNTVFKSKLKDKVKGKITTGRWPANFILTHLDGCGLKGIKKIKEGKKNTDREVGLYKDGLKKGSKDHHQGEETIHDWACVEDCPVKSLDDQSGILKSGAMDSIAKGGQYTTFGKMYERRVQNPASEGGASRFFKQFKKDNDQ